MLSVATPLLLNCGLLSGPFDFVDRLVTSQEWEGGYHYLSYPLSALGNSMLLPVVLFCPSKHAYALASALLVLWRLPSDLSLTILITRGCWRRIFLSLVLVHLQNLFMSQELLMTRAAGRASVLFCFWVWCQKASARHFLSTTQFLSPSALLYPSSWLCLQRCSYLFELLSSLFSHLCKSDSWWFSLSHWPDL